VKHRVFLRHCDHYDAKRIQEIVGETMDTLSLRPHGRTMVKPNGVMAGRNFPHAHTRAEFLDGVLGALRERDENVERLQVGERSGITVPTRYVFREAGFLPILKRHNAEFRPFDEEEQVKVSLTGAARLRDFLFVPETVALTDFFVNCPKFKAHPWTTVTFSLKNYIGLQDDRHRLIDHDHRLDEKIADLQEVIQPRLVAIDAIIAGQRSMLTPSPFPLHLVILGDNQIAVDAVCTRILGLDPSEIEHIRFSAERGIGSLEPDDISIEGDVSFEEACKRAEGFDVGRKRVEPFFEGTPIQAIAGPPPEPERTDYCWGGCPGAAQEAVEVLRLMDPELDQKLRPMTLVFGKVDEAIVPVGDNPVVFIGDCACHSGCVRGEPVVVESIYEDRSSKCPNRAQMTDIFVKIVQMFWRLLGVRRKNVIRIPGCPVSMSEQVYVLSNLGGVANPYFRPNEFLPFLRGWIGWRAVKLWRWLRRRPYQKTA